MSERSKDWIEEAERLIKYGKKIVEFCKVLLSKI